MARLRLVGGSDQIFNARPDDRWCDTVEGLGGNTSLVFVE
jgi:hypothetical protein